MGGVCVRKAVGSEITDQLGSSVDYIQREELCT